MTNRGAQILLIALALEGAGRESTSALADETPTQCRTRQSDARRNLPRKLLEYRRTCQNPSPEQLAAEPAVPACGPSTEGHRAPDDSLLCSPMCPPMESRTSGGGLTFRPHHAQENAFCTVPIRTEILAAIPPVDAYQTQTSFREANETSLTRFRQQKNLLLGALGVSDVTGTDGAPPLGERLLPRLERAREKAQQALDASGANRITDASQRQILNSFRARARELIQSVSALRGNGSFSEENANRVWRGYFELMTGCRDQRECARPERGSLFGKRNSIDGAWPVFTMGDPSEVSSLPPALADFRAEMRPVADFMESLDGETLLHKFSKSFDELRLIRECRDRFAGLRYYERYRTRTCPPCPRVNANPGGGNGGVNATVTVVAPVVDACSCSRPGGPAVGVCDPAPDCPTPDRVLPDPAPSPEPPPLGTYNDVMGVCVMDDPVARTCRIADSEPE